MSEYTNAFEDRTSDLEALSSGLCSDCTECMDACGETPAAFVHGIEDGSIHDEGSFSSSDCDLCGSTLAGDRYVYHFLIGGKLQHGDDACVDCVVFMANGDEPESWGGAS